MNLDALSVRETVKVEWWDDGFHPRRDEVIEICHDNGVQTVVLPRPYWGVFDAFIEQTGFIGLLALILMTFLGMMVIVALLSSIAGRKSAAASLGTSIADSSVTQANEGD